jgi:hypothetical protein
MNAQPQQSQTPPDITWVVSLEKANMILSFLAKQPFEVISPIMDDLRQQATNQLQLLQSGGAAMSNGSMGERVPEPRTLS